MKKKKVIKKSQKEKVNQKEEKKKKEEEGEEVIYTRVASSALESAQKYTQSLPLHPRAPNKP